jgi:hypothetical protein
VNLTFDPQTHRYTLNGQPVPSVTGMIKLVMPREYRDEFARDRGTAVHMATDLEDRGQLDESSLDERIIPYVNAWRKFKAEAKAKVIHTEMAVGHPLYRYAGTLDNIVEIGGDMVLVDKKTGDIVPEVQIQLALYELAYYATVPKARKIQRRLAIQLKEDGSYRCHWFDSKHDKQLALSWLTVAQWIKTHNPQQEKGQ